MYLTYAFT